MVRLEPGRGKSAALRRAWENAPGAELTVLFDADVLPAPDGLAKLAAEFSDAKLGAVSGAVEPLNFDPAFAAGYAACELWVFHQVIQTARDRLGLNPPAIGAHRAFRTSALSELPALSPAGGFPSIWQVPGCTWLSPSAAPGWKGPSATWLQPSSNLCWTWWSPRRHFCGACDSSPEISRKPRGGNLQTAACRSMLENRPVEKLAQTGRESQIAEDRVFERDQPE